LPFTLVRLHFAAWAMFPALFASLAFCLGQPGLWSSYFMLPIIEWQSHMILFPIFFPLRWGLMKLFLLRLIWEHDPPNLNFLHNLGWQVHTLPSYWVRWALLLCAGNGLKPRLSPSHTPNWLGLQMWAIGIWLVLSLLSIVWFTILILWSFIVSPWSTKFGLRFLVVGLECFGPSRQGMHRIILDLLKWFYD
jgi:hypothetical protein